MSSCCVTKLLLKAFSWVIILHEVTAFQDDVSPNGAREEPNMEVDSTIQPREQLKKCWIFSHLQKSGGTSIKTILVNGCDSFSKFIYDVPNWCGEKAAPDLSIDPSHDKIIIMGGYTEALRLDPMFNDCAWFTMFRHPISRLVSAFFYCQETPDPCCGARNMPAEAHHNITAFAKYWGNFAVRQFALGMIPAEDVLNYIQTNESPEYDCRKDSGWYWLKMYLEDKSTYPASINHEEGALYGMLQRIKSLIREKFAAVGILEEFNTTISLFDTALQIPGLDWRREFSKIGIQQADHMYEDEEKRILAESWTNSELRSYIDLDMILYEHALDVFHQQAQFYGVD